MGMKYGLNALKMLGLGLYMGSCPLYAGQNDTTYITPKDTTTLGDKVAHFLDYKLGLKRFTQDIPDKMNEELEKNKAAEKLGTGAGNIVKIPGTDIWTTEDLSGKLMDIYRLAVGDPNYRATMTKDGCLFIGYKGLLHDNPVDTAKLATVAEIVNGYPEDNVIDRTEIGIGTSAACEFNAGKYGAGKK